jgi:hypothetical protein
MSRLIPIYTIYSLPYTTFGLDVRYTGRPMAVLLGSPIASGSVSPNCYAHAYDFVSMLFPNISMTATFNSTFDQ